ncbi:MAG: hypothetical protein AAFV43_04405 [Planctomycetota bacterium]
MRSLARFAVVAGLMMHGPAVLAADAVVAEASLLTETLAAVTAGEPADEKQNTADVGEANNSEAEAGDAAACDSALTDTALSEGAACEDAPCEATEACADAPCANDTAAADDGELDHDDGVYRATHSQKQLLQVNAEGLPQRPLKTFCLNPAGDVLAACGANSAGDVRVFSPEGSLIASWDLPFEPEAINTGSDGRVYLAGEGYLARFEPDGTLVNKSSAPHAEVLRNSRDDVREQVIESHKSQLEWMTEYVDDLNEQIEEIDERIEAAERAAEEKQAAASEEASDEAADESADTAPLSKLARWLSARATGQSADTTRDTALRDSLVQQLEMYEQMLESQGEAELTEEQIEQRVDSSISYKMRVASISEADGEVFFATGAKKGYGFAVWRATRHFDNATEIITGLSGCCGQMDVQACCDGIFVAENSRHRVACFDRDGNEQSDWGSGDRDTVEGFASCCNPMNVAFGADGSVYTAESKIGRVKKYTKEGVLTGLVGKVDLIPGCDKVTIAVSPAGDRVYMMDITRNHIVVLEQAGEGEQLAYTEQSAGTAQTDSMVQRLLDALGGGE